MKLIVDISEGVYKNIDSIQNGSIGSKQIINKVKNGTPLDKHDEEIIAETVESIWGKPPYTELLNKLRTEIEDYITHSPYIKSVKDCCRLRDDVMRIIDKYKTERSEE